eukprot:TRINITY_DN17777_c0_g1_i1.p1 TRINITY_DN17777_c0_g1~~TRINITY_DN17777_c0_g1_i1.p1  ORF type:complete len:141 (+),score=28.10 TRINITY_DN17777_c0_g1_i1:39-461(+)
MAGRTLRRLVSSTLIKTVPQCDVFEGNWKYVLVEATEGGLDKMEHLVTQCPCEQCESCGTEGKCDRSCFHKALAKPTCDSLKEQGCKTWMAGGGWITVEPESKTMHVHGVSIAMGPADHKITADKLRDSFPQYTITFDEE